MLHVAACDNETCLALDIRMNRFRAVRFDCKEYIAANDPQKRRDLDECRAIKLFCLTLQT